MGEGCFLCARCPWRTLAENFADLNKKHVRVCGSGTRDSGERRKNAVPRNATVLVWGAGFGIQGRVWVSGDHEVVQVPRGGHDHLVTTVSDSWAKKEGFRMSSPRNLRAKKDNLSGLHRPVSTKWSRPPQALTFIA